MEKLLAQLRIPKTVVFTLKKPVNLEFMDLIHEMVIVLFPQVLTMLELKLNMSSLMIGEHYIAKVTQLLRKRNNMELSAPSNPLGKGKIVMQNPLLSPKPLLKSCLI